MAMTPIIRRPTSGFTLIELMVTLAILAILTMFALPSFRDTIRRNQVSSGSNALLADLNYARAEAINRGQLVTLCPSTDGSNCATSTAWGTGWLVYTYPAGAASSNKAYVAGNILLRSATKQNGTGIWSGQATYPSFGPQGQLKPGTATVPFRFVTCFNAGSGGYTNTSTVPGTELDVNSLGNLSNFPLAAGASCSS